MSYRRLPRTFCRYDGYRIGYHRSGAGPAVLLLHGLGGTADFWQPVVARLRGRHAVLCPDLLGFGLSDKPDLAYTPERHAGAVAAVLRDAGAGELHAVVGHSCGGVVATALLAEGQSATSRLVLAAAPYPSPRFPVRQELLESPLDRLMLGWRPLGLLTHVVLSLAWPALRLLPAPHNLRGAWAGYMDHSIASYVSTAEECLFKADLDRLLPALRDCPTLLLYSPDDRTVPIAHGRRLAAALARSRLTQIDGGHFAVLRSGLEQLVRWIDGDA